MLVLICAGLAIGHTYWYESIGSKAWYLYDGLGYPSSYRASSVSGATSSSQHHGAHFLSSGGTTAASPPLSEHTDGIVLQITHWFLFSLSVEVIAWVRVSFINWICRCTTLTKDNAAQSQNNHTERAAGARSSTSSLIKPARSRRTSWPSRSAPLQDAPTVRQTTNLAFRGTL